MICDRCKLDIKQSESVVELHAIILDDPFLSYTLKIQRHIKCSPSTAQWIIHKNFKPVIDSRKKYTKNQYPSDRQREFEKKYTSSWLKLTEQQEDSTIDLMNLE